MDVRQRHEGFSHTATKGTRPTQSTKVRHTPRRSVPRYVSPFVGARYPVQSGQVGAGWTAQRLYPGISLPSPGVRRTFHHPGNVRVLEVNIYYFLPVLGNLAGLSVSASELSPSGRLTQAPGGGALMPFTPP